MLFFLANICRSKAYWLLVFFFTLSLELIALYYQYELGYGPCVLCIEIRAIVFTIMLASIIGMLCCKVRFIANILNIVMIVSGVFFYLKSQLLVRIERNEIESVCGFKANFPEWLPLDEWIPSIFEPWEACGYTPMMMYDYTMGELLIYCAYFIFAIGALGLATNIFFGKKDTSRSLFKDSSL